MMGVMHRGGSVMGVMHRGGARLSYDTLYVNVSQNTKLSM